VELIERLADAGVQTSESLPTCLCVCVSVCVCVCSDNPEGVWLNCGVGDFFHLRSIQHSNSVSPSLSVCLSVLLFSLLHPVEAGSFVSPKWTPSMATSRDVMNHLTRKEGVVYPVLTPNVKGMEAAIEVGAQEVAIFCSASESFSRRNINCSIDESFERFKGVADLARQHGIVSGRGAGSVLFVSSPACHVGWV
jgi:hypothetical protein